MHTRVGGPWIQKTTHACYGGLATAVGAAHGSNMAREWMRFDGKAALVTGGASGIGRAAASGFVERGARVIVTDLAEDAGQETVAALRSAGAEALFCAHDVADERSWVEVFKLAKQAFGAVDIVVNNAGVAIGRPIVETDIDDWRWVMSVNLDGTFLGVKHAILNMRERGGAIVNVASTVGLVGRPFTGAVAASKAGVRLLTKTAALECAAKGYDIRVNAVLPGGVDTPIFAGQGWWPNHGEEKGRIQAAREDIISDTPMKRLARPEEVTAAILYLASDGASFVTGAELVVDGGFTAK